MVPANPYLLPVVLKILRLGEVCPSSKAKRGQSCSPYERKNRKISFDLPARHNLISPGDRLRSKILCWEREESLCALAFFYGNSCNHVSIEEGAKGYDL
mmetsp:Transcript_15795/g.35574  ORF Transcript_15795/g.35574 Transcript_15795/m.35574 type:complete len:99 (-) Transcript_15795:529-825(-)